MSAITPIRDEDLEFDHGTFDSAAFRQAGPDILAVSCPVIDHTC